MKPKHVLYYLVFFLIGTPKAEELKLPYIEEFTLDIGTPKAEELKLPYIEEFTLDNGMRVLVCPDYSRPTVSFTFHIDRGRIDDPPDKPGLSTLSIAKSGWSTDMYEDEDAVREALLDLGQKDGYGWRRTNEKNSSVRQTFLKEDARAGLEIMSEFLLHATYQHDLGLMWWAWDFFNDNRQNMKPWHVDWQHQRHMYAGIPSFYWEPQVPYSSSDMVEWKEAYVQPQTTSLMVVGDVNILYVKKIVQEMFGSWRPKTHLASKKSTTINLNDSTGIKMRFVDVSDNNINNDARMHITFRGAKTYDPEVDQHAAELAGDIMGFGSGSRMSLRVSENFPSSSNWVNSESLDARYAHVSFVFRTAHSYLLPMYKSAIKELERVSKETITQDELDNIKYLVRRWFEKEMAEPYNLSWLVLKNRALGKSLEEINDLMSRYDEVTLDQVNEAASILFKPDNFMVIAAGTKDSCRAFIDHFENVEFYNYDDQLK